MPGNAEFLLLASFPPAGSSQVWVCSTLSLPSRFFSSATLSAGPSGWPCLNVQPSFHTLAFFSFLWCSFYHLLIFYICHLFYITYSLPFPTGRSTPGRQDSGLFRSDKNLCSEGWLWQISAQWVSAAWSGGLNGCSWTPGTSQESGPQSSSPSSSTFPGLSPLWSIAV